MAFANPNISDLTATTIEKRSKTIADNVTSHNAALLLMKKKGNMSTFDGGTEIREHFSFAENGNGGSYSGLDVLPTAGADVISGAQFQICQYAVPVVYSGRDELLNAGDEQIIDMVAARVDVAEATMSNLLNRHFYLDGTGNSGKNITGLAAALPLANTSGTYGGVDRSVWSKWRNYKFQASVDGAGAATASTIQGYFNTMILGVTRGTDRPTVILAGTNVYSMLQASLQTIQRVMSADLANAGFQNIEYSGIPVVFDSVAAGLNANTAYLLNTNFLKLRSHSDRNFTVLKDKQSINQDATVKTLVWAGNVTLSAPFLNGVFSNT
jgi:hypothetical protein